MPQHMAPMLATLIKEPFDSKEWLFEIKWDGYRSLAYLNGNQVDIISRNNLSFAGRYREVTEALKILGLHAVLDGEIVALNDQGVADFQLLQNWQNNPTRLRYYVFDILWLEGFELTGLPLIERKGLLKKTLPTDNEIIKYSDHIDGNGIHFFQAAVSKGLEGIMAKKTTGIYEVNSRSNSWLKIKANLRQEVVIAGYTLPKNNRNFFGSLLLGVYQNNNLIYVGHTGSGFDTKSLETIYKKLQPLIQDQSAFLAIPKTNGPTTWVRPKLVCEIKFTEWTKNKIARHPIFMGLRVDKNPKLVSFEIPKNMVSKLKKGSKKTAGAVKNSVAKIPAARKKRSPKDQSSSGTSLQLNLTKGEEQSLVVMGRTLNLTNLNKIYWKKARFSKGNMINYYLNIIPYMMPYMKDRPQSLNRHPNGIEGSNFYQKDVKGKVPQWISTYKDHSDSNDALVEYLVCSNPATLIYMANLGCIEMHPWHSRIQSADQPDWCLIDLDPDTNSFDEVMATAHVVKKVLDSLGIPSYPKTSGSTGIHIYIPLGAQYSYDQSRQLAELLVTLVHHELPETTSLERSPSKRKGKIYLDYLQNRHIQTAAAPYSLRPKPGVPVSTPLDWSEIKKGLTMKTYNALTIFNRLKTEGDLFSPVLGKGINLLKALEKIQSLL
ncbi:MAG: hypothetical protein NVS9B7_18660 [Flavisolibacter sp.]